MNILAFSISVSLPPLSLFLSHTFWSVSFLSLFICDDKNAYFFKVKGSSYTNNSYIE